MVRPRIPSLLTLCSTMLGGILLIASLEAATNTQASSASFATIEGEVRIQIEDYPNEHRSKLRHFIVEGSNRREIIFPTGSKLPALKTGDRIRLHGKLQGKSLLLGETDLQGLQFTGTPQPDQPYPGITTQDTTATSAGPGGPTGGIGEQSIAVIVLRFDSDPTYVPASTDTVNSIVFNDVDGFYRQQSYGQTWLTGKTFGPFTISIDQSQCDPASIATAADNQAALLGINLAPFHRRIYIFPRIGACYWNGSADVGSANSAVTTRAFINNAVDASVIAHEMGHNLGMYHAHSLNCGAVPYDPNPANCTFSEYGDPYDVMGSGNILTGHFGALRKEFLGWLTLSVSTVSGLYDINPLGEASSAVKGLKLRPNPQAPYCVDFHPENPQIADQILVRIPVGPGETNLLNMAANPNLAPGLHVGQLFNDPTSGYQYQLSAVSSKAATLRAEAPTSFISAYTPGSLNSVRTGDLGMKITIGANPVSVISLGRFNIPGNNQTHLLRIFEVGNKTPVPGSSVFVPMGGSPGQFVYGFLPAPVTLLPGVSYYVVSSESFGTDVFYDEASQVTPTSIASVDGAGQLQDFSQWLSLTSSNHSLGLINFQYVSQPPNQLPVASIAANPTSGPAPLTVLFDGTGSFDPDGIIQSYTWDFGDGKTTSVSSAYHIYDNPGIYQASLKVVDLRNGIATKSVTITVSPAVPTTSAQLTFSCDNAFDAYVNGNHVGSGTDWTQAQIFTASLPAGNNVIAVKGIDSGGVAACVADVQAGTQHWGSGPSWKVLRSAPPSGWEQPGFNDSSWSNATDYGAYGQPGLVWTQAGSVKNIPNPTPAHWIWSSDYTNDDTVYMRFTFNVGGATQIPVVFGGSATGTAGQAFDYQIQATNNPTSYSASNLPAGLSINSLTGRITGTPTAAGTASITLSASNTAGTSTAATLSLTINGAAPVTTVWVEDALPTGASSGSDGGDAWTWITSNPVPFSGAKAHKSNLAASVEHQHYFLNATQTLTVNTGDTLFAYVYLDPVNPPNEIMLQWKDSVWDHRAYWGSNQITFGTDGTVSRRYMGPLPPAGQWVKLAVPASVIGVEGHTLNGMAYTLYAGQASWDYAGKTSGGTLALPVVTGGSVQGALGQAFSYQIQATNKPTSYGASNLPAGLSINTQTGLIAGTPSTATNGAVTVTLSATNSAGTGTASLQLSILIPLIPVVPGTPGGFLASSSLAGPLRNNYGGWVGYRFTVGNSPLSVSALGRLAAPGNTGTHDVRIVAADGLTQLARVSIPMAGASANSFKYVSLSAPVTLSANTAYYIASLEQSGGDQWYDYQNQLTLTSAGTIDGQAADFGSGMTIVFISGQGSSANHGYVPVDFKYSVVSNTPVPGSIITAVDNAYQLYFNGSSIGSGSNWQQAQTYSVNFVPGDNVIALKGIDQGGVAAALAEIQLSGRRIGSSTAWKVSKTCPSGWEQPSFDDSSWPSATDYGAFGTTGLPWTTYGPVQGIPSGTPAHWIWTSDWANDDLACFRYHVNPLTITSQSFEPDVQVTPAASSLVHPRAYPNPWRSDRGYENKINFDQMLNYSTVKIFTISGHWVRTLEATGGATAWDLLTDSGDPAASGIYLYVISDPSGNHTRGKIAIIR